MTIIDAAWLKSDGTQQLFKSFSKAGYQLFCVGGCVRNTLLGQPVSDIDMATDATPDQVMAIAKGTGLKSIPTGIDHGTVTIIVNDIPYEITTFRTDHDTDGRHAVVAYSKNVEEDARRRDFTMNALYVGADSKVLDSVGGLDDLKLRHVRFIGDANERIKEDYLRILRFFRFYAWYGTSEGGIDAEGLAACAEGAEGIDALSRERIGAEMCKLLGAPDPAAAIAAMAHAGILRRVMPGAEPAALSMLVHFEAGIPTDWRRRVLALGGEDISGAWRLSKADTRALAQTRKDLDDQRGVAEIAYRHGADPARNAALVMAASLQQPPDPKLEQQIETASAATFPIAAVDLMPAFGGPELGEKLRALEAEWIASDFTLTRDDLLRE